MYTYKYGNLPGKELSKTATITIYPLHATFNMQHIYVRNIIKETCTQTEERATCILHTCTHQLFTFIQI